MRYWNQRLATYYSNVQSVPVNRLIKYDAFAGNGWQIVFLKVNDTIIFKFQQFFCSVGFWFSCSSILHSFILNAVSTSKKFIFIWVFLWVAKPIRSVKKDETKWWRSVLQREGLLNQIWRYRNWYGYILPGLFWSHCLLIWVFFIANRLKIRITQFLELFLLIFIWYVEGFLFSRSGLWARKRSLSNYVWRVHCTYPKVVLDYQSVKKCVTSTASESFQNCVIIVDVANMIVVT